MVILLFHEFERGDSVVLFLNMTPVFVDLFFSEFYNLVQTGNFMFLFVEVRQLKDQFLVIEFKMLVFLNSGFECGVETFLFLLVEGQFLFDFNMMHIFDSEFLKIGF